MSEDFKEPVFLNVVKVKMSGKGTVTPPKPDEGKQEGEE